MQAGSLVIDLSWTSWRDPSPLRFSQTFENQTIKSSISQPKVEENYVFGTCERLSLSRDLLISFLLPCLYPAFFERESVLGSLMYIDGCLLPGKIVLFPACYKVQSDKCLLLWPRVWVSFSARYCYGEGWLLFFFFFFFNISKPGELSSIFFLIATLALTSFLLWFRCGWVKVIIVHENEKKKKTN